MILVLNAGSSSLKIELFDHGLTSVVSGAVTNIGTQGELKLGDARQEVTAVDHAAALAAMLGALDKAGHPISALDAAAHRVVHGGTILTQPARLTTSVIKTIESVVPLAPLHNPNNLAGIYALQHAAPDLPQYCSFGTAFHAANPEVAIRYAIPKTQHDAGIRRYGFHGLSYANMVAEFGADLPHRLLAFHLGNGASLCAILDGKSYATSMGYSPLSGLTMGTRSGDIDGAAVLRMSKAFGEDETDRLLNNASGLKALAGDNNMKTLLARDDPDAKFAVEHFCYWAARHAGSALVAMGGLDAVAFTGGIGENATPVRDRIMELLACFGDVPVHIVTADEEKQIARDALTLIAKGQ
ncbi:acetate/propionate family kinase [Yoonia sediminilitoris]|uniref:Acetate kinase n=1 Tax=Yoonia sediminilitoris TaxID=1286148 RepID=A0A2T6K7Q8_9RHOB|nr:acetate/propionate family kinase [Yoonia sediminilitoris]PUB10703.1 acetate kinase [Yoonia sediminilitoris]RCW90455.1 acetate kinase [Yoonia sediminilitoris]